MDTFTRLLSPLTPRRETVFNDPAVAACASNLAQSFARFDAISARHLARMGAQDVDANAPGYVPGLSKQVMK